MVGKPIPDGKPYPAGAATLSQQRKINNMLESTRGTAKLPFVEIRVIFLHPTACLPSFLHSAEATFLPQSALGLPVRSTVFDKITSHCGKQACCWDEQIAQRLWGARLDGRSAPRAHTDTRNPLLFMLL